MRTALAMLLVLVGCGGAATPRRSSAPRPPLGPLHTLAPSGSSLVVVARPRELLANAAARRVVAAAFREEELDRFAARTGVDPRSLEQLVIAQHPQGVVVLAAGSFDAPFAVREAGERMAPLESATDAPRVRRTGFLGRRRVDLCALTPRVVVWVEGPPQLAARVLAAAGRSVGMRTHALDGGHGAALRTALGRAPLVVYAPRPLELPRDTGIGLLLAREEALGVALRLADAEDLTLHAELLGEFPPGAEENFSALAHAIAESELGTALGAAEALPTLRIVAEDRRIALHLRLAANALAGGLRALLGAEIDELLALEPARPTASEERQVPREQASDW